MSYVLRDGEKPAHAVRRIVRRQLGRVAKYLKTPRREDAIHKAREGLKKARAALRLARARLGTGVYRRLDAKLRAVARGLSGNRDAEVLLDTIDKLRLGPHNRSASVALAELRAFGLRQRYQCLRQSKHSAKRAAIQLHAVRRSLKRMPAGRLKWSELCGSLGRTYEQGLAALRKAERTNAVEDLHKWRKRVKDLRYQLQLLAPARPEAISPLVATAKDLGEQLGDDHDLAMLDTAAQQAELDRPALQSISQLLQPRRARLQAAAFRSGHELYHPKPPAFARRIKRFGKNFSRGERSHAIVRAGSSGFGAPARTLQLPGEMVRTV
jgi:CHAD domain-containing protein